MTKPPSRKPSPARNPHYVKIGQRIRQARLMAKESNSRALSERLGWSGGRINNFETGTSTPGIEETLQLCAVLGVEPCWLTYGVGAPRAADRQAVRHRNLVALLDQAEQAARLPELLEHIGLSPQQAEKHRANAFKPIPDSLARRCEAHLKQPKGWFDRSRSRPSLDATGDEESEWFSLYASLSANDRRRLLAIARLVFDEGNAL
ncbi:helix-turn-helix transcriptional regulator [Magnetovirga frankeli]|uniref:helix-turn-helix domain-containing protein n=1 Tax=Magnetovirga frankeli TaxID=947516 RepID=UPI001AF37167|nr:helix-turn-helix transcriptional regulator [gamma proteobacterium SS-5]